VLLLEKKVNNIDLKTEFCFDDRHSKLVENILVCLEGKTVDVPTGDKANSVIPISILEWFPIVCSKVRLDNSGGSYTAFFNPTIMTFAMKLLLTADRLPPVDVFTGEIQLSRELRNHNDAFCFALIHEIQHAINALKHAYPALTNWKGFLFNIIKIEELFKAENLNHTIDRLTELDRVQDESPIEEELKNLEGTFGTSIHMWFTGYSNFVNDVIMK
jgi:hypothetical protein